MKAIETVLHLRRELPKKMKNMVPEHVWKIAKPYQLTPNDEEQKDSARETLQKGQ
jgi:coenzyme F420 hydrogenase subunit beta